MKINSKILRQIIKEEMQTVLEQESSFSNFKRNIKSLKKKYDAGQIDKETYDKTSKRLKQRFREESDLEDSTLNTMDTLAGANTVAPDATDNFPEDLHDLGTAAPQQDLSDNFPEDLHDLGTAAPQQDDQKMARKYEKVKQILSKLVKEL